MIDKTAGAHKYGWRVWENKLTGPGLSAAPLRLSITDLTGALRKSHTRMTHTCAQPNAVIKLCIWDHSETIQQSPASLSADRVHAFWHVSRAYSYWVVSAGAQNPMQGFIQGWQNFSFSHNVKNILHEADFLLVSRSVQRHFGRQWKKMSGAEELLHLKMGTVRNVAPFFCFVFLHLCIFGLFLNVIMN